MHLLHNLIHNLSYDPDVVLDKANVTHRQYRRWCHQQHLPLPGVTPGLAAEIVLEVELSRNQLLRAFHVTMLELNQCLYQTVKQDNDQYIVRIMRKQASCSELEIKQRFGDKYMDKELMYQEIADKILAGTKPAILAEQYGLTLGRISQLNPNRQPKQRITDEMRAEIRASSESPQALAKRYCIAVNTVYRIRRND